MADVVADGHPGYFSENFVVLADGPIKQGRRRQGPPRRHQRDRLGQRYRDAHDVPQARHQGQRFHHRRGQFRQHAGDARWRQSRPDRRAAAIRPRQSSAIRQVPGAVHRRATRSGRPRPSSGRCAAMSSPRIGRPSSISSRITSAPVRWFLDPKNRDEALAITGGRDQIAEAATSAFAFAKDDFYHSPDARPERDIGAEGDRRAAPSSESCRSASRSARNTSICR